MRSLFIGAEGTLGVITAASLKLFPLPAGTATALVGCGSPQAALELLSRLRGAAGDQLTTFELMPRALTSPNPPQDLASLLTSEFIPEAQRHLGPSLKHDSSVSGNSYNAPTRSNSR